MTRRSLLLALVVTVLAVGCAAPWWEEVWFWMEYRECYYSGDMYHYVSWLDGSTLMPDQPCFCCSHEDHQKCEQERIEDIVDPLRFDCEECTGEMLILPSLRCLCPTCYPERQ